MSSTTRLTGYSVFLGHSKIIGELLLLLIRLLLLEIFKGEEE